MQNPKLATRVRANCPFCKKAGVKKEGELLVINTTTGRALFRICADHQAMREDNDPKLSAVPAT